MRETEKQPAAADPRPAACRSAAASPRAVSDREPERRAESYSEPESLLAPPMAEAEA